MLFRSRSSATIDKQTGRKTRRKVASAAFIEDDSVDEGMGVVGSGSDDGNNHNVWEN